MADSNNVATVYNFLIKNMGYSHAVASAFVGVLQEESTKSLDPEAVNPLSKAYGLCQWLGSRKTYLQKLVGYKTLAVQLSYLATELNGGKNSSGKKFSEDESKTGKMLTYWSNTGETDIEMMVRWIEDTFERSGGDLISERIANAWKIYNGGVDNAAVENTDATTSVYYEANNSTALKETLDYTSLSFYDPYSSLMESNLSQVASVSYDYGYLFDLTNGGEFKFYVPEFTERAGSNWSELDIMGRSVKIMTYTSTNSRYITIKLDLYAGVGLYTGSDPVTDMHNDAHFLKSLEYPDYTNPIARPPSAVQLILGPYINMQGIVKDVIIEHRKPLDSSRRSMYLNISFTFVQQAINPPDYTDIRAGRYYLPASDSETNTSTDTTATTLSEQVES